MMALAIGAAVVPPEPLWFCMTTATATRGAFAGAIETNHVGFGVPGPPFSAVPVLPATLTPGIWAAVPVPPVTTACIIWFTASAVVVRSARFYWCGFVLTIVAPPGEVTRDTTYGRMITPFCPTAAAAMAICSGVTRGWAFAGPWPNARRPTST